MLNGEKISNRMVAFKNAVALKDNGAENQYKLIINAQSEGLQWGNSQWRMQYKKMKIQDNSWQMKHS